MEAITTRLDQQCMRICLSRPEQSNAFDDQLLIQLQQAILQAEENPQVRVILLEAAGKHFSAGADVRWMQRMGQCNEEENFADAMILANTMRAIYESKKPVIAAVQGAAFGGGAGLIAACDIAVAAENARFCFSEVKLGLIPAVISPYVIEAIGQRRARALFITAETFSAEQALQYGLIHHKVALNDLSIQALEIARQITKAAPIAVAKAKALVRQIAHRPVDRALAEETARLIAQIRVSEEGQKGLTAFIEKTPLDWSQKP